MLALLLMLVSSALHPSSGAAQAALETHRAGPQDDVAAPERTATEQTELLLLAPEAILASWTVAFQVELAERGTLVVPLRGSPGQDTADRRAEGQRAALERGAEAAVVVEAVAESYAVRLISSDGASVRVSPSREVDPRTAALIVVSLLDEPRRGADPLDDPAATAEPPGVPSDPVPSNAPGPSVEWTGLVGTGGYMLLDDQHRLPGTQVRGGVGMRYDHLELALLADFGVMLEELSGAELGAGLGIDDSRAVQTLLRVCLEGGFQIPIDAVGLHGGLRACGGYAEQHTAVLPAGFVGGFFLDGFGALLSAGGYLAVSLGLTDSIRLLARAEFGVVAREDSAEQVIPAVSTMLSFRMP